MAGNYRGIPNLVQIGINDTPLTSALEKGDFKAAEKMILENQEPSYLDEGPFEKIPLVMVLSNETEFRTHKRHLRLAKLLVEGGANPNLRIPEAEWHSANASPMEHLLELHDTVVSLCQSRRNFERVEDGCEEVDSVEEMDSNEVDPLFTIGLHDEEDLSLPQLRLQILELMDIFLAYGGNPNVRTTISNSTLFHIALSNPEPDMEMIMKLCEAGGDLNEKNVHGATPLMGLISYAEADKALNYIHSIWKIKPDISSLTDQDCSNETALWKAMLSGSPEVAIELMEKGADPVIRAYVTIGKRPRLIASKKRPFLKEISHNGVSSIFAALLGDSSPNLRYACVQSATYDKDEETNTFNVHLLNKVFSTTISPVVDALPVTQCFPKQVLEEIMSVVSEETRFKPESLLTTAFRPQDIAVLIFGKLSAGLQQMCVRVIMNTVFFSQEPSKSLALIAKIAGRNIVSTKEASEKVEDEADCKMWDEEENKDMGTSDNLNEEVGEKDSESMEVEEDVESVNTDIVQDMDNVNHWSVVKELDRTVIRILVKEHLKLPGSLITRFIVEAIRLQLGAVLYEFESADCIQGCDDDSHVSSHLFDTEASEEEEGSSWSAEFMSSDECDDSGNFWYGEEEEVEEEEEDEEGDDDSSESRNEENSIGEERE